MKELALFDIDGVIYEGNTLFDLIQSQEGGIAPAGTLDNVVSEVRKYKSGEKTYEESADSVLRIYALAIKGKSYSAVYDSSLAYFESNKGKFFSYFADLVEKLKASHDIYFVTTEFQVTTEAIGNIFGINKFLSSIAEAENGLFTGRVELSLAGNKGLVSDLIARYGKVGSIAVGDSENDEDMLNKVEFPFVMEPDDKLKKVAEGHGWQIVNRDNIAGIIEARIKK